MVESDAPAYRVRGCGLECVFCGEGARVVSTRRDEPVGWVTRYHKCSGCGRNHKTVVRIKGEGLNRE